MQACEPYDLHNKISEVKEGVYEECKTSDADRVYDAAIPSQ